MSPWKRRYSETWGPGIWCDQDTEKTGFFLFFLSFLFFWQNYKRHRERATISPFSQNLQNPAFSHIELMQLHMITQTLAILVASLRWTDNGEKKSVREKLRASEGGERLHKKSIIFSIKAEVCHLWSICRCLCWVKKKEME